MASANVSERDFEAVATAAVYALKVGDRENMRVLDKLARKINAAISNQDLSRSAKITGGMQQTGLAWEDVPSPVESYLTVLGKNVDDFPGGVG